MSKGIFVSLCFLAVSILPLPAQRFVSADDALSRKAVEAKPHKRQMRWHQDEFIGFVHFGPNTFTGREWGTGKESPTIFDPQKLDTDQWCETMVAAGMKKAILTVKHHDGFCLWPTRYTSHSVASSPWREGKGDVLRDLAASCKKYGLSLGVYLSPADLYQIESENGLYGNGSEYRERTIPRAVDGRPFAHEKRFRFVVDDYNEYFLNQLFELLTEYGPVHEVWFDGATPKSKGGQKYSYQLWYRLIRELAPEAVIFGRGPDVRWCGNEAGRTRDTEWNVIPIPVPIDQNTWPDLTADDLGSLPKLRAAVAKGATLHYYPAETNTSIRRGWFWRDEKQHVKSVGEILDIWYRSVGGNSVFLLNIPPNRDGLFAERDVAVLREVGRITKATFAENLAKGATASASTSQKGHEAKRALDANHSTCWKPVAQPTIFTPTIASFTAEFPGERTFNRVMFQEDIRNHSQRIARFTVEAEIGGRFVEVHRGTTVGYKCIARIKRITSKRVRIRILESRLQPTISNFGVFDERVPLTKPILSRTKSGVLSIRCALDGPAIRYTLDGTEPTRESLLYDRPIRLPRGGKVRAVAFEQGSDRTSDVAREDFDICPARWKIMSVTSEQKNGHGAEKAIDGDPSTYWHSRWAPEPDLHPHEIVIDLGETLELVGITYTPTGKNGTVRSYTVYGSDALTGTAPAFGGPLASGEFANIGNNPVKQIIEFAGPTPTRYLKFVAESEVNGQDFASAAEFGVITDRR